MSQRQEQQTQSQAVIVMPVYGTPSAGADQWVRYTDPQTGQVYEHSAVINETRWVQPGVQPGLSMAIPVPPPPPLPPPSDPVVAKDEVWHEAVDPATGRTYLYNPTTQETKWPEGRELPEMTIEPTASTPTAQTAQTVTRSAEVVPPTQPATPPTVSMGTE